MVQTLCPRAPCSSTLTLNSGTPGSEPQPPHRASHWSHSASWDAGSKGSPRSPCHTSGLLEALEAAGKTKLQLPNFTNTPFAKRFRQLPWTCSCSVFRVTWHSLRKWNKTTHQGLSVAGCCRKKRSFVSPGRPGALRGRDLHLHHPACTLLPARGSQGPHGICLHVQALTPQVTHGCLATCAACVPWQWDGGQLLDPGCPALVTCLSCQHSTDFHKQLYTKVQTS